MLGKRKVYNITLCLLKRSEKASVGLLDSFPQILVYTLLLNHYLGLGNMHINKAVSLVNLYLFFKFDKTFRVFYSENIAKE